MTTETPGDVRIPISEEPENLGWLYKIIEESDPRILTSKPLIQKVAQTLRGITRNEACFDPSVVSFGPYHHGEEHLNPMERYKEVAALWFIKLSDNPGNAITREGVKQVYDEFVAKVPSVSLRECYTDKFVDKINDADFMRMMFLDGCFMLYFIDLFLDQSSDPLETSHLSRLLILRDMFLLENQIPYSVPVAWKSLKPSLIPGLGDDWAASFFNTFLLPPPPSLVSNALSIILTSFFLCFTVLPAILFILPILFVVYVTMAVLFLVIWLAVRCICCCLWLGDSRSEEGTEDSRFEEGTKDSRFEEGTELQTEPLHLLDLLRSKLTGKEGTKDSRFEEGTELQTETLHLLNLLRSELTGKGVDPSVNGTRHWNYNSRPIRELKAAGIQVSASNSESLSLNNIKLKKGWIDSYLELPRIIIDDSTKTYLLNLAAYEMCPDGSLGPPVITSYICFLNSLICNADDVKELRSSNIMRNCLGSDEEVVNLFRELATNLSPDCNAYSDVIHDMEKHSQRSFNRLRMWIGQFIRIYFSSPWTAISLTAASSVIFLTLVQTIYSILSYNLSKKSLSPK